MGRATHRQCRANNAWDQQRRCEVVGSPAAMHPTAEPKVEQSREGTNSEGLESMSVDIRVDMEGGGPLRPAYLIDLYMGATGIEPMTSTVSR